MNFFPFPLSLILSLSSDMDAFIFLPRGRPTKAGKELDPSLGLMISKSTVIEITLMVLSTFYHTLIGLISPWLDNFR